MNVVRELLNRQRSVLVNGLDIQHGLLNELLSSGVLHDDHLEAIKAVGTISEKIETLIDILKRRRPDDFSKFLEILKKRQSHLTGEIESEYLNSNLNGSSTSIDHSDEIIGGHLFPNSILKLQKELKYIQDDNMQLKTKVEKYKEKLEKKEVELALVNRDLKALEAELEVLREELKQSQVENESVRNEMILKDKKNLQLENLLEGKNKKIKTLELKLTEFEEKYPKFQNELETKGCNIQVRGGCSIMGVAMMYMRIYVVCLKSKKLYVFSDEPPYNQLFSEEHVIHDLNNARDIVSSENDKVLFISDQDDGDNHKIWKLSVIKNLLFERSTSCLQGSAKFSNGIQKQQSLDVSDNNANMYKVVSYSVNRRPSKMFVCPIENRQVGTLLIVLTSSLDKSCNEEYFVYIYKTADMEILKRVILDLRLGEVYHVIVQPPLLRTSQSINFDNSFECPSNDDPLNGTNFIVSHKTRETLDDGEIKSAWLISRVSPLGSTLISTSPTQVDGIDFNESEHLALAEGCRILVADNKNDRLVILGPKFSGSQVLVKKDSKHRFEKPSRILYHLRKRIVIVTHWEKKGIFTVFTH